MYVKLSSLILFFCCAFAQATPVIQNWQADNGSQVYFVPTEGLPLLDVRVLFDAGSARDEQQFGLSYLTAGLLDTGAGKLNADEIAQRLDGVGAKLDTGVSRDSAWLSLRSLTDPKLLSTALETAKEILTHPNFNPADFQREKKNLLLALKHREESPAEIAGLAFFSNLYGDHPYAHPKEGTLPTVEKLNRDDLRRFYQRYYVSKNAIIVIVGSIEASQAKEIAENLLNGLPQGEHAPTLPAVSQPTEAKWLEKSFPSAQTHIYSGLPGMKAGDADYFPLYVGNHILGGSGLVSRISEEVREKRGLSYSASSHFYPLRVEGPFLMVLQTRNDQAEEALKVLNKTLTDFIEQGPSEKEIEASKQNITGGFAMRLDSNQKLLEQVALIANYGLPLDYLDHFIQNVEAVSVEDIKKAFKARIDPNHLQTVRVGGSAH